MTTKTRFGGSRDSQREVAWILERVRLREAALVEVLADGLLVLDEFGGRLGAWQARPSAQRRRAARRESGGRGRRGAGGRGLRGAGPQARHQWCGPGRTTPPRADAAG